MSIFRLFSPVKYNKYPSTYRFSEKAKIASLWVIAILSAVFVFFVSHLIPVFVWAAVAAYLFNPLVNFLSRRTRFSRGFCILILYIVIGVLIFWAVQAFVPLVSGEIRDITSGSADQPSSLIGKVAARGDISVFGNDINVKEAMDSTVSWIISQFPSRAIPLFFGALEKLILTIVFFVITFYFLLESGKYAESFLRIIPDPYREEIASLLERVNMTLGAYIRAQVILIFIMSGASFIVLSILKVKFAIVLSIMTGVFEVVPVIGPIVATAVVASVALLQSSAPFGLSSPILAMLVVAAYFLLRQFEDYFIIPNVASHFVRVHPVLGIFALLVGGSYAGILGLFLAIPTAAILKVIIGYIYGKLTE